MRWRILVILLLFSNLLLAKEWRSLRIYQKTTQKESLSASDWLKSDRINNTIIWHRANVYNLENNLPQEYSKIVQRRDFYEWLYKALDDKKHEILWVKMAHFISKKMHLLEVFPYSLFSKKRIKQYAFNGSETVFKNAFQELKELYHLKSILKGEEANNWDNNILKQEQYIWLDSIYKNIKEKDLKTLHRIAKGTFLYSLVVPKPIRFHDNLSNAKHRLDYAISQLKPYCKEAYK
ncbi:Insecticidal toxin complex protein [uncultured Algibacter sp.]|uniref:Insecticidal toxin complex protein n=1 Tax=uncultured Algibacter sp. TaxID=298659 RepID=UPI0026351F11|nr:Insecticidal toxin complex protein [uncultured Algibacter sp.]